MGQSVGGRHLAKRPERPPRRRSSLLLAGSVLVVLVVALGGLLVVNRPGSSAGCRGGSLPLQVVVTPDQAAVVTQAAADYERGRPTVGSRCVDLQVRSVGSAEATAALASGWDETTQGPRPDVWVPSSSVWASRLQLGLKTAGRPDLIAAGGAKVATSPMVFAMPQPMAKALGWPRKPLGWGDLLGLLSRPDGWAGLGHPSWGPFKLGKTDPNLSTPAVESLIGTVYAATGRSNGLTVEALGKQADQLRRVILGVERTPGPEADTPATLLSNLQRADQGDTALGFLSAVPVDEKSVLDYNQGNPTGSPDGVDQRAEPKVPLVAVYPKDGTLEADHPWIVLRAPWVDDAKRQAAGAFLGHLRSAQVQARFQEAGFRSSTGAPGGRVTEANGLVRDQPTRILAQPDPQVLAVALQSWKAARKRSNVLAVFDVSGSMKEPVPGTPFTKMELARRAALRSLPLFAPETNVGAWVFSTNLAGSRDYAETVPLGPMSAKLAQGRTRRELLASRLATLQATDGDTGLYDTALASFQYVKQHYVPDRLNLVVLLTDGINDDPGGGVGLPEVLRKLKAEQGDRPVHFVTIAYGANADRAALKQIAAASGGAAYESRDPREIERILVSVITNL
jgi:Ca-activated chloride channel homolog